MCKHHFSGKLKKSKILMFLMIFHIFDFSLFGIFSLFRHFGIFGVLWVGVEVGIGAQMAREGAVDVSSSEL